MSGGYKPTDDSALTWADLDDDEREPRFTCEGCGEELPVKLLAKHSDHLCDDCHGSGVGEDD